MNSFFQKYSGVIGIVINFVTIIICFLLFGPFDIKLDTMSDFAINDRTFFLFNTGLIIGIIFNIIFVFNLKTKKQIVKILLYLGIVGLNGLLIFPTQYRPTEWNQDRILHWIFTFIYFIAYSLGILIFSLDIKHKKVKNIALIIAILNIIATVLFLVLGNKALTELSSIALIGVWIIFVSFAKVDERKN